MGSPFHGKCSGRFLRTIAELRPQPPPAPACGSRPRLACFLPEDQKNDANVHGSWGAPVYMTDAPIPAAPSAPPDSSVPVTLAEIDTTSGSIIHYLYHILNRDRLSPHLYKFYLILVWPTFAALLIGSFFGPLPLTHPEGALRVPFFYDWATFFWVFISVPTLIILTVTDQAVLAGSIERLQSDSIILFQRDVQNKLVARWQRYFRLTNLYGQLLSAIIGFVSTYYAGVSLLLVGSWQAHEGQFLPGGVIFLILTFIFYSFVSVYVVRVLAITLLLRDIVANAELNMLPLHPDGAGGLRPVGRLGLRNQYLLSVFGLTLVIVVSEMLRYQSPLPPISVYLIISIVVAYLLLSPVVFIGPLLPFHRAMLNSKSQLMSEVARRMRVELTRLRAQLPSGPISKEDEELIERLQGIGAVITGLPVWPFDIGTLRKFFAALALPFLGTAANPLMRFVFDQLRALLYH